MTSGLRGRAAIAGIGATEFSRDAGRSELQLAAEAVRAALADAGLMPADVSGLVTYTLDLSNELELARIIGVPELRYFARAPYGGAATCAVLLQACMAVATGVADVVVFYRAINQSAGLRYGRPQPVVDHHAMLRNVAGGGSRWWSWYLPFGLATPAQWSALQFQRYMHVYGVTNEDFGRYSVVARANAATNPAAAFHGQPITLDDHQQSKWIVEPVLRLLDCCQESDGGIAVVVTAPERARDLRQPPVHVLAAAQGALERTDMVSNYYQDDITAWTEMQLVGGQLWQQSGLAPDDIDVALLYDHFSPIVLLHLEALGFCKPGDASGFIASGAIARDGALPVNPHGGLLGEGYLHGINHITEAVRQLRGTAANQIDGARTAIVTAGMSGAVLSS